MWKAIVLSLLMCFSISAYAEKKPRMTPMELQALQQKEFETSKEALFASVMSVFQDLGYTVDSADLVTGFITASSATKNKTNFGEALFGVSASGNTKATAFIEKMPNGLARVRLNFLNSKVSSSLYGQSAKNDKPVLDAATYQAAWEKIDEALFVRNALDAPSSPAPVAAIEAAKSPPDAAEPESLDPVKPEPQS
jgi:hypothetical protein